MTCFNAGSTIADSIKSVSNQSFSDWQLVIIDNCSTDETVSIISGFKDERVRLTALDRNIGRTLALNRGLSLCHGEYVAILDADDICRQDRMAIQVSKLDSDPNLACIGSWYKNISSNGQIISEQCPPSKHSKIVRQMAYDNPISHSTVMYRSEEIKKIGGYPIAFNYAQDFGLWLKIAKIGKFEIIPDFLCSIRRTHSTLSQNADMGIDLTSDGYRLYKQAQLLPGLKIYDRLRGVKTIGFYGLFYAWRLLLAGRILSALRIALLNIWAAPWAIIYLIRNRISSNSN